MKDYDHKNIEKKWQAEWEKAGIYNVEDKVDGKENYYTLVEFTYPSGNLHVGHWYAFAVPDIFARYKRMNGFNVLYPMGFDAFGLPAENAAIKDGADPKIWTFTQMDKMRTQLRSMGAMFPWEREVVSCEPQYYKWTQWMFNQFLKNDLVYRDVTKVNWCPKDQTILANEQVIDGKCDRCGSEVEQRSQEQWMLRITKYADRLIDDLDKLDWPHSIKESQKNWIGRSDGSEIEFKIKDHGRTVKVFTTRADTLFGVTYIVLAPEHPSAGEFSVQSENMAEITEYIRESKKKSELDRQQSKEKTGVELKGIKAINPVNGEEVPVWIADYVLAGYGTGAVMAVPAHDERDFEFAKKYNLPIKYVIVPNDERVHGVGALLKNKNGEYLFQRRDDKGREPNGLSTFGGHRIKGESIIDCLKRELQEELEFDLEKYPYRFASIYIHPTEGPHLFFEIDEVDDSKLVLHEGTRIEKVSLEEAINSAEFSEKQQKLIKQYLFNNEFCFEENGKLINSDKFEGLTSEEAKKKITEFVGGKMVKTYRLRDWGISRQRYWGCPIPIVYDPEGKAHPVPDEHLPWILPTDVDHTPDGTSPLARSKELLERTEKIFGAGWKPEVETMDTFVDSSWYFYRYLDNKNNNEFASKEKIDSWMPIDLYMGGAEHTTMHLLYSRFWAKALHDLGLVKDDEAYVIRRNRGLILGSDGEKMSKSKGNVINPDEIVDRLGADTVRLYLSFMGPYGVTTNYPWDPNGVVGVRRFLERVWRLKEKIDTEKKVCKTDALVHKTIKGVNDDVPEFKFNTAISKMMILVNALEKEEKIVEKSYKNLLQLLAPFAPHMTEELWREMGESESIHLSPWPKFDEKLIVEDMVNFVVQVSGKVRAVLNIATGMDEEEIKKLAHENADIQKWLEGKEVAKYIFIKDKILNIVING